MANPTKVVDFTTWYGKLFELYQQEKYAEGLEIALREGEAYFPQFKHTIYHYRACMQACLGEGEAALATLQAALDAGLWFSDLYWDDADFDAVRDDPRYAAMRAVSDARFQAALAEAEPQLEIHTPADTTGALPLLIGLHGNQSNLEIMGDRWVPASEHGWLVGAAQSSQLSVPNAYVWDDLDKATQEVQAHYATLTAAHPVDTERVVLSGFSMGGETAIRMTLNGDIPARGFLAVAPGGPYTNREAEKWDPVIERGKARGVRGYFIIGGNDNGYEAIRGLIAKLEAAGIPVQVEEHAELGHDFPADFAERLPEMLRWVLGA